MVFLRLKQQNLCMMANLYDFCILKKANALNSSTAYVFEGENIDGYYKIELPKTENGVCTGINNQIIRNCNDEIKVFNYEKKQNCLKLQNNQVKEY